MQTLYKVYVLYADYSQASTNIIETVQSSGWVTGEVTEEVEEWGEWECVLRGEVNLSWL